eukprot:SAG25_NODE_1623_length_2656_cov_1.888150_1_plen_128_part_10
MYAKSAKGQRQAVSHCGDGDVSRHRISVVDTWGAVRSCDRQSGGVPPCPALWEERAPPDLVSDSRGRHESFCCSDSRGRHESFCCAEQLAMAVGGASQLPAPAARPPGTSQLYTVVATWDLSLSYKIR